MKDTQFKVGDWVAVLPHFYFQHLVGNALVKPARQRRHPGYKAARILDFVCDDVVEVEVGDGEVDYVSMTDLKPLA